MHLLSPVFFCVLAVGISAIPLDSTSTAHEKRDSIPKTWIKQDRLEESIILPVRVGMTQSNLDKGYDMLMEVSQHDSPKYGMHYSAEEVADIFAPTNLTVNVVRDWLLSAGIPTESITQSANKQWMQFDTTVHVLESLLNTEYHLYEHSVTGTSDISCDQYHVPAHVREHVDYITPGIKLFTPVRKGAPNQIEKRTFGVTSGQGNAGFIPPLLESLGMTITSLLASPPLSICDRYITPVCVKALYNITDPTKAAPGNQLGIFEDLDDVYSQTDLDEFFISLSPNIPVGTHPILEAIDGAVAPNPVDSAGAESDLDFQISYPLIYPQNSVLFQTDDPVYESNYIYQGFLNNFLYAIDGSYCSSGTSSNLDPIYPDPQAGGFQGSLQCGIYQPTNVISISYGGQEADLPLSYQQRQCNEFMKLGMQGVSVVLASGDSGVAGPQDDDSANGCLNGGLVFSPDFPATCPYITTVGATTLPQGADVNIDAEVAVTRFGSGGGFSNIYPVPRYQQQAVTTYFKTSPPPYKSYSGNSNMNIGAGGGIYNSAGRGYPDVSAVGDNVIIYNKGIPVLIGGTSASAPVFASVLNRINEERIAAKKSTVGFVNPTLYANPQVLHDITVGSNPGCNTNGFSAAKGWDPITGLGTPNYPAMLKLFMSL